MPLSSIGSVESVDSHPAVMPEIIYKGIGNASRAPIESMLDRAYHPTMCESHVLQSVKRGLKIDYLFQPRRRGTFHCCGKVGYCRHHLLFYSKKAKTVPSRCF